MKPVVAVALLACLGSAAMAQSAQYVGRARVRRVPRQGRQAPGAGHTTISRCRSPTKSRCSAISPTPSSPTRGRRRCSPGATASSSCAPMGRTASSPTTRSSTRSASHPLQQYLIELPGGRLQALEHRLGCAPEGAGRAALVSPLSRPEHQGGRLAALDLGRPELELHLRRMPLDQPAQELRRQGECLQDDVVGAQRRRARRATARDRAMSSWARKQGDWKALDATKGLAVALDERKGVTWAPRRGHG